MWDKVIISILKKESDSEPVAITKIKCYKCMIMVKCQMKVLVVFSYQ